MINIDSSKKSSKSSELCSSKRFWILWNILQNVLFFFTNLSLGNFFYCPKSFIVTKNLNTVHTPTDWIETKTVACNFFFFFFLKFFWNYWSIYWSKFYANISTGSGFMTIFVYKGFDQNTENQKYPRLSFVQ